MGDRNWRDPQASDDVLRSSSYRKGVREYVLRRDPNCVRCLRRGVIPLPETKHVDHIVPRSQGGSVFDPRNMQGLCARCHNEKSAAERWGNRKPEEPPKMKDGRPNPDWIAWRKQLLETPRKRPAARR